MRAVAAIDALLICYCCDATPNGVLTAASDDGPKVGAVWRPRLTVEKVFGFGVGDD
jgi:hypothetical protein